MAEAELPIIAIEAGEEAEAGLQGERALANAAEATGESKNGVEGLNELLKGTPGSAWNSAWKMLDASTGGALGTAESAMDWVGNTLEPWLGLESMDDALGDIERYIGYADSETSKSLVPYQGSTGRELVPTNTNNSAAKIDSFFNEVANQYTSDQPNWGEMFEKWTKEWLKQKGKQAADWGKRKATGILKSGAERAKRQLVSTAQQMLQERKRALTGTQNLVEEKPGSSKRQRTMNLTHPRHGPYHRYKLHKYFLGKKRTQNYKNFLY